MEEVPRSRLARVEVVDLAERGERLHHSHVTPPPPARAQSRSLLSVVICRRTSARTFRMASQQPGVEPVITDLPFGSLILM